MRINNRTYPILKSLNQGTLNDLIYFSNELDKQVLESIYPLLNFLFMIGNKGFKEKIYNISEPFDMASKKSETKLFELYGDIIQNDISDFIVNGTFIQKDTVTFINYVTKKGSDNQSIIYFIFHKKGFPICFFVDGEIRNMLPKHSPYAWLSSVYNIQLKDVEKYIYSSFAKTITIDMFTKYADVETNILKPKTKTKIFNCKYINDTDFNITHLDSKWFTNLVQSNSFNVRGHFRLQPYKNTKKLIWIDEFKKHGYTSKAKKTPTN